VSVRSEIGIKLVGVLDVGPFGSSCFGFLCNTFISE
jgi:hypothetical protein